ncbi:MAG: hypothetical protein CL489_10825 [Acidobacteria bacterium]|nr:hypothetical protein [Acidobacteriota bacterium]|tara:strand:- start:8502 stop:9071 length:570 start_codon:yes stop_codon:yes gene_type:complete
MKDDTLTGDTLTMVAIAIIPYEDGFVAVSRKDNPDDFGFPGGKVEDGETPLAGVIREVYEEIGLFPNKLEKLLVLHDAEQDVVLHCFYMEPCEKEIQTEEIHRICKVSPTDLSRGVFGRINQDIFKMILSNYTNLTNNYHLAFDMNLYTALARITHIIEEHHYGGYLSDLHNSSSGPTSLEGWIYKATP